MIDVAVVLSLTGNQAAEIAAGADMTVTPAAPFRTEHRCADAVKADVDVISTRDNAPRATKEAAVSVAALKPVVLVKSYNFAALILLLMGQNAQAVPAVTC